MSFKKGISLKNKMETYSLGYSTKELVESVEENIDKEPNSSVYSNGKRAWFKEDRPKVLSQIDKELRKYFNIGDKTKSTICLYYPPSTDEKNMFIKDRNENVLHRVLVSTINEFPEISFGSLQGEVVSLNSWTAYKSPQMVGGMLNYIFTNSKSYTTPSKKGFRQLRKIKNISDRYVLVFDYIIGTEDLVKLGESLKNLSTNSKNIDKDVEDAISNLS